MRGERKSNRGHSEESGREPRFVEAGTVRRQGPQNRGPEPHLQAPSPQRGEKGKTRRDEKIPEKLATLFTGFASSC
jgi:hypothetical protein